jgi:hypothetical protein
MPLAVICPHRIETPRIGTDLVGGGRSNRSADKAMGEVRVGGEGLLEAPKRRGMASCGAGGVTHAIGSWDAGGGTALGPEQPGSVWW